MIRTDRWKLIVTPAAGMIQLFDIEADPWEMHNLAADAKSAPMTDDLIVRLKRWMQNIGDPLPAARFDASLEAYRTSR
jgi:arylsulfatase A-like enzyme